MSKVKTVAIFLVCVHTKLPLILTVYSLTDLEEELADYNGDDENEGEFEADKQAELAQI